MVVFVEMFKPQSLFPKKYNFPANQIRNSKCNKLFRPDLRLREEWGPGFSGVRAGKRNGVLQAAAEFSPIDPIVWASDANNG